jgi:hypothetical protein
MICEQDNKESCTSQRTLQNDVDAIREDDANFLSQTYGDESVRLSSPDAYRLIDTPIPDIPKESEVKQPPSEVTTLTEEIVSGRETSIEPDIDQEIVAHFNERYHRMLNQYGQIKGRYKYWKAVLDSEAGRETRGIVRMAVWAVKILFLILKTRAQ